MLLATIDECKCTHSKLVTFLDPLGLVFALLVQLLSVYDSVCLLSTMPSHEFGHARMPKLILYTICEDDDE